MGVVTVPIGRIFIGRSRKGRVDVWLSEGNLVESGPSGTSVNAIFPIVKRIIHAAEPLKAVARQAGGKRPVEGHREIAGQYSNAGLDRRAPRAGTTCD